MFAWADKWQISFNASKCQLLTITRKRKPRTHTYIVANQTIEKTDHHKYLGVTISHDLTWSKHISNIKIKASNTLGIIRRNLGPCTKKVKLKAYQALVRPQLEYAAAAWNPHTAGNIQSLEAVQRQAVRFIWGEYDRHASITPLREELKLDTLHDRRLMTQCTMFYKIRNQFVNMQFPHCVKLHNTQSRTEHQLRYNPIQAARNSYKYSFYGRVIPIWNRLPMGAVTAPSISTFQTAALPAVRALQVTATHHQL